MEELWINLHKPLLNESLGQILNSSYVIHQAFDVRPCQPGHVVTRGRVQLGKFEGKNNSWVESKCQRDYARKSYFWEV